MQIESLPAPTCPHKGSDLGAATAGKDIVLEAGFSERTPVESRPTSPTCPHFLPLRLRCEPQEGEAGVDGKERAAAGTAGGEPGVSSSLAVSEANVWDCHSVFGLPGREPILEPGDVE